MMFKVIVLVLEYICIVLTPSLFDSQRQRRVNASSNYFTHTFLNVRKLQIGQFVPVESDPTYALYVVLQIVDLSIQKRNSKPFSAILTKGCLKRIVLLFPGSIK